MVPPPPERFSTTADWPHAVCRCAASSRPITSVVPPGAAGTIRRTVSVGRQSPAPRLARGRIAAVESAAAPVNTRRREKELVLNVFTPYGAVALAGTLGSRERPGKRRLGAGGRSGAAHLLVRCTDSGTRKMDQLKLSS